MEKYSDLDLIEGLRAGDTEVFSYLFDTFYGSLQYFAEKLIQNREEARDIVVNTFSKLWNIRANFESMPNLKAFLFITARNNCLDFLKFQRRQNEGKKVYGNHLLLIQDVEVTERAIIRADFMAKIYRQVESLPEKCKQIFILTYVKDMKANEIAAELNITVSNVTSQRHRAIQYLRDFLSEEQFVIFIILLSSF